MENPIDPIVGQKKKFNKIGIIIIAVLIIAVTGILIYKYYSNLPPKTFVSNEDCDQNFAIVFEFNEGISEEEAANTIKNYNANLRSLWSSEYSNTVYGSICIQDGQKYLYGGEQHPLLNKLKNDSKFKDIHIEHLSVPM